MQELHTNFTFFDFKKRTNHDFKKEKSFLKFSQKISKKC